MTFHLRTPLSSFRALVGPLLILWLPSAEATSAEDRRTEIKVQAEVRQLVRRLSTAKEPALEEIRQRLVELHGNGLPIKRILCEAIAGQNEKGVQNALSILKTISAETAESAQTLASPGLAAPAIPAVIFDRYTHSFEELRKNRELDPAVSPLVVGTLLQLARLGNAMGGNSAARDVQSDVYDRGVQLLFALALRDDDAYGDLLRLAALRSPGHGEELIRWKSMNLVSRAAGENAERAQAALPVLTGALSEVVRPAPRRRESPALSGLSRAVSRARAYTVLNELGQLGPHAAPAIPHVRALLNDPTLRSAAARTLAKIHGGN